MSTKTERTAAIDELAKAFAEAQGIFVTDNNKITVAKVNKLRDDTRKQGMRYLVVKNTLARIAAEKCGKTAMGSYFKGPTGVVVSGTDGAAPAKLISEFQKANENLLSVKVAYVDGSLFTDTQVKELADLPSREVLLGQLLGCLQAPMGKLAATLAGITTTFVRTLDAVREKKGS